MQGNQTADYRQVIADEKAQPNLRAQNKQESEQPYDVAEASLSRHMLSHSASFSLLNPSDGILATEHTGCIQAALCTGCGRALHLNRTRGVLWTERLTERVIFSSPPRGVKPGETYHSVRSPVAA